MVRQQAGEGIFETVGAVELLPSPHHDILTFSKVGNEDCGPAKWADEELDNWAVEIHEMLLHPVGYLFRLAEVGHHGRYVAPDALGGIFVVGYTRYWSGPEGYWEKVKSDTNTDDDQELCHHALTSEPTKLEHRYHRHSQMRKGCRVRTGSSRQPCQAAVVVSSAPGLQAALPGMECGVPKLRQRLWRSSCCVYITLRWRDLVLQGYRCVTRGLQPQMESILVRYNHPRKSSQMLSYTNARRGEFGQWEQLDSAVPSTA
ncbi:hypothetical protein M8818_001463 [Zalaria obscura]|uniref:Uncharacterized protein n=1 Tax=Zalaria obscura TaxID=2024903 RepID=A0ACC3SKT3_9PEZI